MEIYKYKIWTGKIPGMASPRCEEPTLVRPPISPPTRPPSLDCTPCEALFDNVMIMNACMDCHSGLVNVCCPARGESCCGLIEDPCQPMYEMTVEQQNKYCIGCGNNNSSTIRAILGTTFSVNRHGTNSISDPLDLCKCCNRTGRNDQESNLVIFLDQDYNDIGHYSMWDGTMDQQDTFSNFVVVGDPLDPMTASILNTTDFNFFKFLKDIQYTIDWGDGLGASTTVTAPISTTNYTYTNPGTYIINIQMSAPWGVSSVSHTATVPYQTGANILSSIVNTGQTYTFTPPGFTTPVSMDYETSDWGPLDSGLDINGYVTSNYNSAAIAGYTIQGVTDSMLSSLQSYNPNDQTLGLPPGYALGNPVSVAGQSQLPDGSFVDNLMGEIINFDPDPYVGWTAYTITNCGVSPCQTFTMFDHVSGETIFETLSYGLNPEDYLLRECGYAIQGACDVCNGVQVYYDGTSYTTQDVYNDRGVWDITEDYEPTDFVYWDGCCFFAVSIIIAGIEPDPTDTSSPFWRVCYGSCPLDDLLPPKYDCIGGTCVLISPTSPYYPSAQFSGPTGADALNACISHPCVPTTGDPIHYNCVDGNCVPVSPSAFGWAGADFQGVGALSLCQAAQNAGTCIQTTTNYSCVPDGAGGTNCVPTPVGIYPDLISCQNNCGGVILFYDWYCINVPPGPNNGNTGHDCQAVPQGNAPPLDAVIPLQGPYPSDQDCVNNGCGAITYQWYCKCTIGIEEAIVDLGTGQYGGHGCTQLSNGPAGGFNDKTLCEDNCVSWECDGHGLCEGPHNVTDGPIGSYCSEFDMVNGGLKYWTDQTYIDVPGCDDDCDVPNAWVCMGGLCTEVLENSTCINNNHVNNGTVFNGSCIDWAFANNMPSQGCIENDETQCNANLSQGCGGGCGPCDGIVNEMGMTEWPFRLYSSTDAYNAFDVVIGFSYSDSQANSEHKYWYKPFPICDPTIGIIDPDGIPNNGDEIDCGDPNIIEICESAAYGSGTYHPCTDLSAPACDTPPIINMAVPTGAGDSRFTSRTCWEPCNE